ncbi:hypothetical protein GOB10_04140 [Sinorhizobium meliloti]|nr:hypothetical protein [Sinorhizobium meliloti]MDW9690404.1 hypothetical protein [Sinorhizobium meliloti]MDW9715249.1 hypothetical protein [Sinorhizobium meliloti]MDW9752474.1 hypothetical protein [Sinorhizobium meliloti]MDW9894987.1 hypothetical protein [Sinorhizobium meliloti]
MDDGSEGKMWIASHVGGASKLNWAADDLHSVFVAAAGVHPCYVFAVVCTQRFAECTISEESVSPACRKLRPACHALSQSATSRPVALSSWRMMPSGMTPDLKSDCQLYDMSKGSHRPFAAIILRSSVDYKVAADCEPSMHGDFVSG